MDWNYRFNERVAVDLIEKIIWVAIILVVTWALAKAAKWAFAKLVDNVSFFRRHQTSSGESIGNALGKIVGLLIWLFGLVAVLLVLDLGEVMAPLQRLLNDIASFIPSLIGAGIIFFVGLMIAKIARDITVTALQTVDFDRWLSRGGADHVTGTTTATTAGVTADGMTADPAVSGSTGSTGNAISRTIGTIVYALIVIIVSIAALNVLDIEVISGPATNMLELILAAIPRIIGAAILLGIGYLISRFVVQILKEVLPSLGVDRALSETGMVSGATSVSGIIARVAQVAIILFFAIAATRMLGFPELTAVLGQILEVGAKVVFGAVIIGVGFLIANLLSRIIAGDSGESLAANIVKWATIVVFVFMGLSQMDLGEGIIEMAFGALVIGGGVAGALAFGLGGREWAGRKLEELDNKAREVSATGSSSSATAAGTKTASASISTKPLPPGA